MHVTNTTGDDKYVAPLGDVVAAGDTVELDDDAARSLLDQGWSDSGATTEAETTHAGDNADTPAADEATDQADEATDPED